MAISTTDLTTFRQRIARRLDDEGMAFWSGAELNDLINEALNTFHAFAAYTITTKSVTLQPDTWLYDLSSSVITSYPLASVLATLQNALLEAIAYHDQYPSPNEMLTAAVTNARREWQQDTGLAVSYRTIDASGTFIALGIGHIQPVHIDWKPYARTYQRRLNPIDAQDFIANGVPEYGKPWGYSILAGDMNRIRLVPTPDEASEIRLFELNESDEIPLCVKWALKYGALAQVLTVDGQIRDLQRAEYARKRWEDAKKLALNLPLYRNAFIDDVPVRITSLADLSSHSTQWQFETGTPNTVVTVGWTQLVVNPYLAVGAGTKQLRLEMFDPPSELSADSDVLPVAAELESVIEDFVIHLALFKVSGAEFMATMGAYENLIKAAMRYNSRIAVLMPNLSVGQEKATLERKHRKQSEGSDEA